MLNTEEEISREIRLAIKKQKAGKALGIDPDGGMKARGRRVREMGVGILQ